MMSDGQINGRHKIKKRGLTLHDHPSGSYLDLNAHNSLDCPS
jgi:hypothetical protein